MLQSKWLVNLPTFFHNLNRSHTTIREEGLTIWENFRNVVYVFPRWELKMALKRSNVEDTKSTRDVIRPTWDLNQILLIPAQWDAQHNEQVLIETLLYFKILNFIFFNKIYSNYSLKNLKNLNNGVNKKHRNLMQNINWPLWKDCESFLFI